MLSSLWQSIRCFTACVFIAAFAVPGQVMAQSHLVSPSDLQKEMIAARETRQQRLEKVTGFLSSDRAQQAMKSARIDPQQVKNAIPTLSDEELTRLASRVDNAQHDFAAGTLSDRDLILIILAIAVLVLLIVAIR